jgi:AraC family transcriptional regulator of adaptative response/methylated-DNA-[protein]-cysteine methyltransferase
VNDYARVEKVIRHLEREFRGQPDLKRLAALVGLSEFHFHRLFTRWAGVSPKDFVQALTAEHAKRLLRERATVLDAALESGLSGPGRLHDLLVTLDGVTPGELREGRIAIRWGIHASPFGDALVGVTSRGICHLSFDLDVEGLRAAWPEAGLARSQAATARAAAAAFGGKRCRVLARGTAFQLSVWRALLRIPSGSVLSYGGLSSALGLEGGARAVGSAIARNSVAFLIPCHRVIRETGALGGYRWGETRKRAILAWEAS